MLDIGTIIFGVVISLVTMGIVKLLADLSSHEHKNKLSNGDSSLSPSDSISSDCGSRGDNCDGGGDAGD
jgi:hypothetical protein